jgi:microcystin-dependent protein
MAEPFMGEIRIVSFNFPPKGWAFCNGQLLPINQNQALFALMGTTYGGDGRVNFGLPDFRGRVSMHVGNEHILGEKGGSAAVTVSQPQMPQHIHFQQASTNSAGTSADPTGRYLAPVNGGYVPGGSAQVPLSAQMVTPAGGSQPHENRMPGLVLNFIVALQGIFPSPN